MAIVLRATAPSERGKQGAPVLHYWSSSQCPVLLPIDQRFEQDQIVGQEGKPEWVGVNNPVHPRLLQNYLSR